LRPLETDPIAACDRGAVFGTGVWAYKSCTYANPELPRLTICKKRLAAEAAGALCCLFHTDEYPYHTNGADRADWWHYDSVRDP